MTLRLPRSRTAPRLLGLDDALRALGDDGLMERYGDEIPLVDVVGSLARAGEYDECFRPVGRRDERLRQVERRFAAGSAPPAIDVVRLGELYFVVDGHHRVAVARARGWDTLPAQVRRHCTVAYAMCCLRVAHLDSKAAERRFLEQVPLPGELRAGLWLDRPADWARLADAAHGWAHRSGRVAGGGPHDLAAAWWEQEVVPVLARLREGGVGEHLRDVQLFVTALAVRDGLGTLDWPDDLPARLGAAPVASGACCGHD